MLFGLDGRLGLLGYASFFAQIDFAFQNLKDLEHNGWWQGAFATATGTCAATGRVDQVLGPAVHRVGPEFALRDGHSLLARHVFGKLAEAAEDVLLPHVVEHDFETD